MNIENLNSSSKVKLSLHISPRMNELIEQLADESGSTKSDLLRKAISLLQVASTAKRDGHGIGVIDRERRVLTEIVGL
jgi:hypothetical protein